MVSGKHTKHSEWNMENFAKLIIWSLAPWQTVLSMQFRITIVLKDSFYMWSVFGFAVYSHVLLLLKQGSLKIIFELSTNCEIFVLIDVWKPMEN